MRADMPFQEHANNAEKQKSFRESRRRMGAGRRGGFR
jgi:hypothetical protein